MAVKMSVNLPDEAVENLRAIAEKNGITLTDALRQSIANEKFLDESVLDLTKEKAEDQAFGTASAVRVATRTKTVEEEQEKVRGRLAQVAHCRSGRSHPLSRSGRSCRLAHHRTGEVVDRGHSEPPHRPCRNSSRLLLRPEAVDRPRSPDAGADISRLESAPMRL